MNTIYKKIVLSSLFVFLGTFTLSCDKVEKVKVGVYNLKLRKCQKDVGCVSSSNRPDDVKHYISPIDTKNDSITNRERMVKVIKSMRSTRIIRENREYLYVQFTSNVFKFVDDVEFYFDDRKVYMRSSSRFKFYDFGVNRRRLIKIRRRFLQTK